MKFRRKHWFGLALLLGAIVFAVWYIFLRRIARVGIVDVPVITGGSGRSTEELDSIIADALAGDGT